MSRHSVIRFIAMIVGGLIAGAATVATGGWEYAPSVGWATAALIYSAWVWIVVGRFDGEQTRAHAIVEEPARGVADALIVVLSVASLASVGLVLVQAAVASGIERALIAGLAIGSVALSWILLHTLFALRYARLYYREPAGGIDFNQDEKPRYTDFAYLAFTIGMAYTPAEARPDRADTRKVVLGHALLSYLFGTGLIAVAVSLVTNLGS